MVAKILLNSTAAAGGGGGGKLASPLQVEVRSVDFDTVFKGTPLEEWYYGRYLKLATRPILDLCDAMRLALLYTIGGTYLDLDIISLNRMDGLGRVMAAVDEGATEPTHLSFHAKQAPWGGLFFIGNALFRFPPRDPFILAAMKELPRRYDPLKWANTGPYLITRVYENHCRAGSEARGGWGVGGAGGGMEQHCKSLTVLEPRALCPVFMFNNQVLMHRWEERCYQMRDIARSTFGLHWWNSDLSKRGALPQGAMLAKTTELACPATFQDLKTSAMLGPQVYSEGYKYTLEAAKATHTHGTHHLATHTHGTRHGPLSYDEALDFAKRQTVDHRVVASVRLHLARTSDIYGAGSGAALTVMTKLARILHELARSISDEAVYPALYREAIALSEEVLAAGGRGEGGEGGGAGGGREDVPTGAGGLGHLPRTGSASPYSELADHELADHELADHGNERSKMLQVLQFTYSQKSACYSGFIVKVQGY
jgi:hypothetical protein